MSDLVPVIRSDAHLAHTGLTELASGVEIPCFESPERIMAIEAALEADGGFAFEAATEHGRAPILAVHDAAMVDVFEHAWTDALAAGADGSRAYFPDVFLIGAYQERMALDAMPAGARHRHRCLDAIVERPVFEEPRQDAVHPYSVARMPVGIEFRKAGKCQSDGAG